MYTNPAVKASPAPVVSATSTWGLGGAGPAEGGFGEGHPQESPRAASGQGASDARAHARRSAELRPTHTDPIQRGPNDLPQRPHRLTSYTRRGRTFYRPTHMSMVVKRGKQAPQTKAPLAHVVNVHEAAVLALGGAEAVGRALAAGGDEDARRRRQLVGDLCPEGEGWGLGWG